MSKQARLSDVPASGKAAGRILQRGRLLSLKPGPAFTSREEDRQLIGRSEINHTLQTTQQPPHIYTRNHASRRPKTQDPQNQRQSRRLNFLRFRFPPGIPHGLPQAQSAARRTWPRAGAKKGEGSGSAGEKRGAHNVLPKISDQRNNMLT
jgi:hypothetical protein